MKKFTYILILSFLANIFLFLGAYAQRKFGLKINDVQYERIPRKSSNIKFRGILPTYFSLQQYMPAIGDQGDYGTCTAFAVTTMRTMLEAKKNGFANQSNLIASVRFSPTYIYERIKERSDYNCQNGSSIVDALDLMKNQGAALLSDCPYQCGNTCNGVNVGNYKIEGYATLFGVNANSSTKDKIQLLKSALVESENAVPIGMMIPESFVNTDGTWEANPGEDVEHALGAHAMAIIGFDDNKNGGSFLIANSWGASWGDNGLTWGRYSDVIKFTKYAFQVFGSAKPNPAPTAVNLKGNIEFMMNNTPMPVYSMVNRGIGVTGSEDNHAELVSYNMGPYTSGTRFKMTINNNKQSYLYIIGSDLTNNVTKLFPTSSKSSTTISPIVPANSQVLMPFAEDAFILDNQVGEDYFLILIADKQLDLNEISNRIKSEQGTFIQKVYSALGSELIAPNDINYTRDKVSYEVKGNPKGSIVPLLIKIAHK